MQVLTIFENSGERIEETSVEGEDVKPEKVIEIVPSNAPPMPSGAPLGCPPVLYPVEHILPCIIHPHQYR